MAGIDIAQLPRGIAESVRTADSFDFLTDGKVLAAPRGQTFIKWAVIPGDGSVADNPVEARTYLLDQGLDVLLVGDGSVKPWSGQPIPGADVAGDGKADASMRDPNFLLIKWVEPDVVGVAVDTSDTLL